MSLSLGGHRRRLHDVVAGHQLGHGRDDHPLVVGRVDAALGQLLAAAGVLEDERAAVDLDASLYTPATSGGVPLHDRRVGGRRGLQLGVRGDQSGEQQHEGGGGDHSDAGPPNGGR